MKKILFFPIVMVCFVLCANAAVPSQRRSQPTTETDGVSSVSARSAIRSTTTRSSVSTPSSTSLRTTSARSAAPVAQTTVSARAGTTQKVINTGTKISAANKNIVVNEVCKQKYEGCMDSFCMLDNENGGRCLCSNRKSELDKVLAEIQKLDAQSYKMATEGVERIEMGADADAAIAAANNSVKNLLEDKESSTRKRTLDLNLWNQTETTDEEDLFAEKEQGALDGKTGDELYNSVSQICVAQIPECSNDMPMLQMIYAQNIKSDCAAYENDLTKQKNASSQKLAAAEKALRDAALDSLRAANKYDLGQCTIEFKKCMSNTAGCKDDFTGCVGIAAAENAQMSSSSKSSMKKVDIKGSNTKISVAASTMDALESKKPMCDNITNSCVAVKDQVWITFLREVAPTLKTAELLAESDLRTNCIANISSCFQKACKDTMDPNDPDGSYDMCLSRPDTVKSLCKVQIDPCVAAEPQIMDFVKARLAAMRVDACTLEVKECFTNENTCGENFQNCIGLDLSDIKKMCPIDKLVACQKNGSLNGIDELDDIIKGIYLSIDNSMLTQCQAAVSEKMMELCGGTDRCGAFDDDKYIGTESLASYKNNDGDYVIEGLISFGNVKVEKTQSTDSDVKFGRYEININDYKNNMDSTDVLKSRVIASLQSTANKINQKIAILSQDPKIKMCVEGRDMSQISGNRANKNSEARYPNLLDSSILTIINSGLEKANSNYSKTYDNLVKTAVENQGHDIKSVMCAAMASEKNPPKTCKSRSRFGFCTEYEVINPFENIFSETSEKGMSGDMYSTRYVITGAKVSTLADIAAAGRSDFTQTDEKGNMVGKVSMSAVYSQSDSTCNITTVTTMCESMKEIITTETTDSCDGGGFSLIGSSSCDGSSGGILSFGSGSQSTKTVENFRGVSCIKFMEPKTVTNSISM
ncbi:MAG: hypothetical protein JW974_00070 [Alphaproteobacteria bacterium]|nr:hypothetical protein [Alphaproteobacteria bacterium]MBN2675089.1 hypothetical protein [Alphaproteobacteria bacterium]